MYTRPHFQTASRDRLLREREDHRKKHVNLPQRLPWTLRTHVRDWKLARFVIWRTFRTSCSTHHVACWAYINHCCISQVERPARGWWGRDGQRAPRAVDGGGGFVLDVGATVVASKDLYLPSQRGDRAESGYKHFSINVLGMRFQRGGNAHYWRSTGGKCGFASEAET